MNDQRNTHRQALGVDKALHLIKLDRFDPILDYYVAQGHVVVAPNFREGLEIDDVYKVGRGVKKIIKNLGIDPSQVFLTSISAGSNINFRMIQFKY